MLKGKIEDTFILTNCDILIDDDLTKAYQQHIELGNVITMVCSLKNFVIPYGVVNIGEKGTIQSMQEKPNLSFFYEYRMLFCRTRSNRKIWNITNQ